MIIILLSSHGCSTVKSPNYFIAEAPSNPLLNLPFKVETIVRKKAIPYFRVQSELAKPVLYAHVTSYTSIRH